MDIRLHTPSDHPALVELRWLFRTADGRDVADHDKTGFFERYRAHLAACDRAGGTVHLIAESDGTLVGVMTVRIVAMEPAPDQVHDAWGYLTNAYVLPAWRNRGVGSRLIEAVTSWAVEHRLELLIVWPSEASERFYRRAGFAGRDEPLVLLLSGRE